MKETDRDNERGRAGALWCIYMKKKRQKEKMRDRDS